ncbi:helix-turn-helix domain-containing protein [Lactococcus petauri]|nr:helix-turn-helix domain-containing protein [Lactococcus petauri]
MPFSEWFYTLRIRRCLSQEKLAELLHVSRQSISQWERGLTSPNLDNFKDLLLLLDVSVVELQDLFSLINSK